MDVVIGIVRTVTGGTIQDVGAGNSVGG